MSKVAVVTGAGSGIGRAVSLALAGAGWRVALAGRRAEALQETLASGPPGSMLAVPTDVSDPAQVAALFAKTVATFGRVDLLFNNAGSGAPPIEIDEHDIGHWRRVVDVNLTGAFLCTRAAFGQMKRQDPKGGRIINNGSVSAHVPRLGSAPYTMTKHAVTGLTKALSLDGRAHGIACGQIDVGNALTGMVDAMTKGVPQADGRLAVEATMDVADVARSVLHMASLPPEANVQFMTVIATTMPFIGRG
jgi:NAD(P)-dependent dehydrogenase (short-subunit alcohol dehydrogenase family)